MFQYLWDSILNIGKSYWIEGCKHGHLQTKHYPTDTATFQLDIGYSVENFQKSYPHLSATLQLAVGNNSALHTYIDTILNLTLDNHMQY
jgi:hypothetical protein